MYVSPVTNYTYIYNTTMTDNKNAHKMCNSQGGHLVAYQSLEEQVDVEQYFIKQVRAGRRFAAWPGATSATARRILTRHPPRRASCSPPTSSATGLG